MTPMRDQLPHRGLEDWKWSDLRTAVADDAPGLTSALPVSVSALDGMRVSAGVSVDGEDAMSELAAEYANGATRIVIPAGAAYDQPLVIRDLAQGHGQIEVVVGEGATLDVEEVHESANGFVNLDLRYAVKAGATLRRSVLSNDAATVVRHVRARIALWDGATLRQTVLSFGGHFTRLETRLACMGAVDAELSGAYLLNGSRHADLTHYTDLAAPGSRVRDKVAGVVTDRARGVFQGKFHVRRPAQHTDAVMRHDALMLSDTSRVNAKPELEIYADDVECAHGNTLGQLDESALFYMRQRGIHLAQARALLLEAFVVARLGEDEAMAEQVRSWLAR